MSEIDLIDVTVHVDETLDEQGQHRLEASLRDLGGVVSVHMQAGNPHLVMVEYDRRQLGNQDILARVEGDGLHAELVGL